MAKDKTPEPAAATAVPAPDEAVEVEQPPADETAVVEVAAEPEGGGDGLLGMFQESKLEIEDLSIIVDLAGDVEMSDLLEDLHTLAAALGITIGAQQELATELALAA